MRTLILGLTLAFLGILGFLTLYALLTGGPPDVLELLSVLVLGLLAFGVIGALATPPREG